MSTRTLDAQPAIVGLPMKSRSVWRQRRLHLALLLVAGLVIGAVVANTLVSAHFTPAATVSAYLEAVSDGDAATALLQIEAVSAAQSDVYLTDAAAMRSALATTRPDIRSFAVTSTTYLDSAQTQASVGVTFDTASGTKQTSFSVMRAAQNQYGLYPTWRLELPATILTITALGPVSIDGKQIALPAGTPATVAVLPLAHRIVFAGTDMLQQQVTRIDAFALPVAAITYRPALTSSGLARAKAAVANAFVACAQRTQAQPDACPQSVNDDFSGQWSLVGDPTSDLSISVEQNTLVVGRGHYQMVFAYQETSLSGSEHDVSAGGYRASLVLAPSDIAVASLSADNSVPSLQRPAAATDQAALALVAKALSVCAGSTSLFQADCPQGMFSAVAENVHWQLHGDPTKGATVSYEPTTGIFDVHGPLDMTASYTVNGYPETDSSFNTGYDALLLWDGQQLELVSIGGKAS